MKRRALGKKNPPQKRNRRKFNKIRGQSQSSRKFEELDCKIKELKMKRNLSNQDEITHFEESAVELELLQKIDYHSFVGYIVAYGLFNCIYWIDMLCY